MPLNYVITVSPGPEKPEIAAYWAARLSDKATIERIKAAIEEVNWRDVLDAAAKGFAEFMGTDDPRRALAALKHSAMLAATDAAKAKENLLKVLSEDESGKIPYADAVKAAEAKFAARTRYVIPATNAAGSFVKAFVDWAKEKITPYANYFAGAVSAVTVYAAFLGVVFADAVKNGGISKDEALQILGRAADDMKAVLDVIVDGKGVEATVTVNIDEATPAASFTVQIPDPSG